MHGIQVGWIMFLRPTLGRVVFEQIARAHYQETCNSVLNKLPHHNNSFHKRRAPNFCL